MANVYQSVLGGGGVTPTDITPSDSSPVALSANGVYKALAAGYAIESYSSKTPDDTTPPTVSNGEIVKMGGAGYLYATQQSGGVTLTPSQKTAVCVRNTSTTVTIDTSKHYIVTAVMRVSTTGATRGGSWYVNEGSASQLSVDADANANVSVSGKTLTLQGTQSSYNIEFRVIQLD